MDERCIRNKGIELRKIPAVSCKDTAGITLVALVITIIVLIMLATTTINLILGENGIVTKAKEAKIRQEVAQITEQLELKKLDIAILDDNQGIIPISEYIEEVQNDEKMQYKVTSVEIVDEETAYIIVAGEYEYLLEQEENGNLKITYQGEVKNLVPKIQSFNISSTTNKIEVKLSATKAEKYAFNIKEKNAAEYIKKEENETGEYIFRELTANKEYSIKLEAINRNGKDEIEVNRTTGEMTNLTQAEVKYIKSDTNWTNEDVTTTIEIDTEKDITNYELQYTKFTEGTEVTSEALENATWLEYETSGIVSEENETIYTRLYDGVNSTSYTSTTIANIDTEDPTVSTTLNSTEVTTKGFTLNIGVTDTSSGLGKIIWYYKLSTDTNYTSEEEIYTPLNGIEKGTTVATSKSITLDNLTNGTYSVYAEVYDVAGNSTETAKINIPLVEIEQASGATASPEYWTSETVTVTLPTESGFITEYQTEVLHEDGSWIPYNSISKVPVSSNTTVYYRFNDGKNSGVYGSKQVSNIDTEAPTVSTTLNATGVTTKGFTLNIGVTDTGSGLGKIVWYYKLSTDDGNYTSQESPYATINGTTAGEKTAVTKSITLDNLTNGTYSAYAVVYDVAGKSTETAKINIPLTGIAQASGATASPAYWTSGTVTVTLPTQSGFTTEHQIGTLNETGTWIPYNSTNKVPISSNTTVYYRFNDGKNAGKYAAKQVSNIDTTPPTVSTNLSSSAVTTTGFTLNIGVTDTGSGLGKIVWYYKLSTESTYSTQESPYVTINGTTAGETTAVTKSKAITGLLSGKTYNAYALVYNVAGITTKSNDITIQVDCNHVDTNNDGYCDICGLQGTIVYNYHSHTGDSSNGGGCYTTANTHSHSGSSGLSYSNGCYTSKSSTTCGRYTISRSKTCSTCNGSGNGTYHSAYYDKCSSCNGNKTVTCSSCSGSGNGTYHAAYYDPCSKCSGNKKVTCSTCSGKEKVECSICDGDGSYPQDNSATCSTCKGNGYINVCNYYLCGKTFSDAEYAANNFFCPYCDRGTAEDEDCSMCGGDGKVWGKVTCITCKGLGRVDCTTCKGLGRVNCTTCSGSGNGTYHAAYYDKCSTCSGNKTVTCSSCRGSGNGTYHSAYYDKCSSCNGNKTVFSHYECTGCTSTSSSYGGTHSKTVYELGCGYNAGQVLSYSLGCNKTTSTLESQYTKFD